MSSSHNRSARMRHLSSSSRESNIHRKLSCSQHQLQIFDASSAEAQRKA
ncbi:unnamed protein product [Ixodes pacificus]